MPKLNTTVKAVRIDNDKLAELESRLGHQTINSWMNEKIAEFIEGKPVKTEKNSGLSAELRDIEAMVGLFGVSFDDFSKKLCEAMNDGTIYIDEGEIKVQTDLMLDEFYEVCHEKNVEPQEAINKVVQMLRR